MGTGRFGGGGSGALGKAGSGMNIARGADAASSGGVKGTGKGVGKGGGGFFGWKSAKGGKPDFKSARELIRATTAQRNVAAYIHRLSVSQVVQDYYGELVRFSALVAKGQGWDPVEKAYGVKGTRGCLAEFESVIEGLHTSSLVEAHREVARSAVMDVLLATVRNDDDVFLFGDAKSVLNAMDPSVFASLSGHYFGSILRRALLRELPALDEREGPVVRDAIQERADFIISKFAAQFKGPDTSYRDLLRVIADNQNWFEDRLRQEIE